MSAVIRIALTAAAINLAVSAALQADTEQERFFSAVASGKTSKMTALMHPALVDQIDEPVLNVWMQALNERLGEISGITEQTRNVKQTFNGRLVETSATVQFERGTASSELATLDGKLVSFDVQSDQLNGDWFQGPSETTLYQKLGERLIRTIMDAQADAAYAMCHTAVHEAIDREGFRKLVNQVATNGGELESVSFKSSEMQIDEQTQTLVLRYDVVGRRASGTCEVKVQFIGLKGHIMGFNFR